MKAFYADRHKIHRRLSKRVDGTAYTGHPTVKDIGINHIGLLSPAAVMARAQGFRELIEEFRFGRRRGIGGKDATRLPGRIGPISGYDFQRHFCSGHSSAPKTFETYGRNLRTYDAHQNHSVEKQKQLNTLKAICQ